MQPSSVTTRVATDPAGKLRPLALSAGLLYLAIILLGGWGELGVRGALVVAGDAAATARAITASTGLWRAGLAGDLLMQVLDVPLIVIFYVLLRPVSRSLALLASGLNGVQTAVLAVNKLNLLWPLFLLADTGVVSAIPLDQRQAWAYLAIEAHDHGFAIGLIFFGFACLVHGVLMTRSDFFPRPLGVLLFIAGLSYLVNSVALLVAPALASQLFPGILAPALIGESAVCGWLIWRGVRREAR